MRGKGKEALLKFRDEDNCDCAFTFVFIDNDERVRDSQLEKEFEGMLRDVVDLLDLEHITRRKAYRINEEQAQYLRGAAFGFCFAMNRRLSSGFCSASLCGY